MRFHLSDEEWTVIQPHLPKAGRGPKRISDRRVINGIFYILRTGAPWRDLPNRYGPRTTVYNRYARWARNMEVDLRCARQPKRGQFVLYRQLYREGPPCGKRRKREELAQDIDRSRGGRTSKVHAAVDESGRPRCLIITGGQVHDCTVMIDLLDDAGESAAVVADKAYNSGSIRQRIADQGSLAVIPTKSNAKKPIPHDKALYRMRNIVERFFCTMKDMKRLTTRYEKLSENFLAMIHIFAIRLWAN